MRIKEIYPQDFTRIGRGVLLAELIFSDAID
jgi:hypothetical protein